MEAVTEAVSGSLPTRVPRCVRELLEHLSSKFHCMHGQPRAFMEIRASPPVGGWPQTRGGGYSRYDVTFEPPFVRGVYQTLRFAMRASQADAEPTLVAAMLNVFDEARADFVKANEDQPLLFWRMMPHVETYAPGGLCIGVDGDGAEVLNEGPITILRCRVWVPGVTLPAEGIEPTYL